MRARDDPAIAAANPGLALPALTIVPVVRGDGTGSSLVLTQWLADRHPAIWTDFCARAGRLPCVPSRYYPTVPGIVAQTGADRVAGYVARQAGEGAITYVENSVPPTSIPSPAGTTTPPRGKDPDIVGVPDPRIVGAAATLLEAGEDDTALSPTPIEPAHEPQPGPHPDPSD